jgi:catechol 1,2-dioxygenase
MTGKEEGAPTEEVFPKLTRDVIDRMSSAKSGRLQEVMEIVIRHLHAIVREAKITQGEWWQAIDFLTRAGKMCSESRQELILLSDILGVSMLVDAVVVAGPGISDSTASARPCRSPARARSRRQYPVSGGSERAVGDERPCH